MTSVFDSKTYQSDLQRSLSLIDFSPLKEKTIFITGANGLICSTVTDILLLANKELNLKIKLHIATRNIEKSKQRFSSDNSINFVEYDATKKLNFQENADYYIHGASPASPELFVSEPVETMTSNFFGLKEILDKAKSSSSRTLYISSSEIYGRLFSSSPLKEDECGTINLLDPRSSYAQSKRAAETLCASYIKEYNSNIVIVRPGHIYGPTASLNDKRVSSQFMYDAFNGKNLTLKSKGLQLRSYTYCIDCATAILFTLLKGKNGEAYNISNPYSIMSIADMASYFAKFSGVELKYDIPEEDEKKAFNPMDNSSLDSRKLCSLGWKSLFSKEEGFEHSIKILSEIK